MNVYVGDSSKAVHCTRNSLETLHPGALTYIEDYNKLKRASVNKDTNKIEIEEVMLMVGPDSSTETPTDMWVFD